MNTIIRDVYRCQVSHSEYLLCEPQKPTVGIRASAETPANLKNFALLIVSMIRALDARCEDDKTPQNVGVDESVR